MLVTLLSLLPRPALECRPKGLAGEEATRAMQSNNHKKKDREPAAIVRSTVEICVNLDFGMGFEFHIISRYSRIRSQIIGSHVQDRRLTVTAVPLDVEATTRCLVVGGYTQYQSLNLMQAISASPSRVFKPHTTRILVQFGPILPGLGIVQDRCQHL